MSRWIYCKGTPFLDFSSFSAVEEEKCVLFLWVKLKPKQIETLCLLLNLRTLTAHFLNF